MTELTLRIKLGDEIDILGEIVIEDLIRDMLLKMNYDVIKVKAI